MNGQYVHRDTYYQELKKKIRALEAEIAQWETNHSDCQILEARVKDLQNVATKEARGREDATARAEKAEAELAAARKRVDWLPHDRDPDDERECAG